MANLNNMNEYAHLVDPEKFYWSKSLGNTIRGADLTASDIVSLYCEANLAVGKKFETYGLSDEEINEALLRAARHKAAHESLEKLYKSAENETGMTAFERYMAMAAQRKKGK